MRPFKINTKTYPSNLVDISNEQIGEHIKLYSGYVDNANELLIDLEKMRSRGLVETKIYEDRRRRLAYEVNGIKLHELYFDNLAAGISIDTAPSFQKKVLTEWGSVEDLLKDLWRCALTRSPGWAVCSYDPWNDSIFNTWISDHDIGCVLWQNPLIVIDAWEHAYAADYSISNGRPQYLGAVFRNIDWACVDGRMGAIDQNITIGI